jgi:hypothetical protein
MALIARRFTRPGGKVISGVQKKGGAMKRTPSEAELFENDTGKILAVGGPQTTREPFLEDM